MAKKKIYRGGVIPYFYDADGQLMMLFMKPSEERYGGVDFQIAKGKREDDEDDETAAFREAREELGLFKPNCAEITHLGEFLGRTAIYHCRVEDPMDSMFGTPCDETEETKWMTPEEFQAEGRTLHKPVVKAAVRSIERKSKK
jgi:8-oxo-dGTP pyrophosphatase MutT (NUDIX family)